MSSDPPLAQSGPMDQDPGSGIQASKSSVGAGFAQRTGRPVVCSTSASQYVSSGGQPASMVLASSVRATPPPLEPPGAPMPGPTDNARPAVVKYPPTVTCTASKSAATAAKLGTTHVPSHPVTRHQSCRCDFVTSSGYRAASSIQSRGARTSNTRTSDATASGQAIASECPGASSTRTNPTGPKSRRDRVDQTRRESAGADHQCPLCGAAGSVGRLAAERSSSIV